MRDAIAWGSLEKKGVAFMIMPTLPLSPARSAASARKAWSGLRLGRRVDASRFLGRSNEAPLTNVQGGFPTMASKGLSFRIGGNGP
ncbi:MAG: hypothetical protein ABL931_17290, partial [Usitatibacteraceae bacterium]